MYVREIIIYIVFILGLSGCSTYDSSFICPDAKGPSCTSMSRIYQMVESGEIEVDTANESCKGKKCKKYRAPKAPSHKVSKSSITYYKS